MSASFWLDSSEDSIFFTPSSNLYSRSSTDSLDINNIPSLDKYPSLLLPSCSLDSLPLCDYEPIKPPPCPLTSPRRRRTHAFLSLVASLAFPRNNRPTRTYTNVLVSSPTPERLKNIPQLRPTLKTWISAIPSSTPPDMTPWSPPRERPHYVWVPEGSCFPPSYLKHYLRGRHRHVGKLLPSMSGDFRLPATSKYSERPESPSLSLPLRRCASQSAHHPRSPERDLAYNLVTSPPPRLCGKQRRWSLGVPPSYLSIEFNNRRLELQRIDAILRAHSAQSDTLQDTPPLPLPAIKVSTSTATIAISVPGSPETPAPALEPLAVRRGQKMIAPLILHSPRRIDEGYSGIPTAFLDTLSPHSPQFQFASSSAQPGLKSLAIGDMISTLRSQVSGLKPSSPAEACVPLLDKPPSANFLPATSLDISPSISEDEWAFAHDLMSRYGEDAQFRKQSGEKQRAPRARKSLTPKTRPAIQSSRTRRASVPPVASTPKNRPKPNSAPRTDLVKPRHSTSALRHSRSTHQTTLDTGTRRHVPRLASGLSPSVSPDSPVTPSHTTALVCDSPITSHSPSRSDFSDKHPPGILKHVKSVRFADMPKKDNVLDNTPSVSQPQTSTLKSQGGPPSLQPSPLRTYFVPEKLEAKPPSRKPYATPPTEIPTPILTADRRSSVQLAFTQSMNSPRSPKFNAPAYPATVESPDKGQPSGNSQRATKTLSLLVREYEKDRDKENGPLPLRPQRRARRHGQVDENAARRASSGESGGRKHRLSSPLKSFLERLRA
ncbi:hypothetical protein B0F90DRAFT_1695813 [Multifurca ochricompacta]|uniref:Uncharacterized protein n=1 Tax=Multifurca ochricompacta TaxID=376703 RepID=A0AAD4M9R3_9AGAM|nr:hypothetical protein B0F90DRAFT_1695813 [Multifurca ochricompacta]